MQFGMIDWYVPLSIYPADYGENPKVPLSFVALGSQKSCMVLHFLCFYGHPTLSTWFTSEYRKSGKKLDMGKGYGSSGGIAVQKVVAQTAIAAFNCVLWTLRSELPQRHFRVT